MDLEDLDYDPLLYVDKSIIPALDWGHPERQKDHDRDALRALAAQIEKVGELDYVRIGWLDNGVYGRGYVIVTDRDHSRYAGEFTNEECRAYLCGMEKALRLRAEVQRRRTTGVS